MFQIITPSTGDRILTTRFTTNSLIRPGIIIPRVMFQKRTAGLRPTTYGRDKFFNTNCDHFNIVGSLSSLDFPGSIVKDGALYYVDEKRTIKAPLHKEITINGKLPCTDLIHIGKSCLLERKPYYVLSGYTRRYDSSLKITMITFNRYRFENIVVRTRVGGAEEAYSDNVSYVEFDSAFSQYRKLDLVVTSRDAHIKRFVAPTGNWISLLAYATTITGESSPIPIQPIDIYRRLTKIRAEAQSQDLLTWGGLTADAAQGLKVFDVGILKYLGDFLTLKGMYTGFKAAVNFPGAKGVVNSYLSYFYGIRLTAKDTVEISKSITRAIGTSLKEYTTSRARVRKQISTVLPSGLPITLFSEYNLMLYCKYRDEQLVGILREMLRFELFPTTELAWDLIPLSFVLDWFVPIGDLLELVDSRTLLSTYKILSSVYSRRTTFQFLIQDLYPELANKFSGTLGIVDYHRYQSKVPPPIRLDYTSPKTFTHWVEGAALLVQRIL